MLSDERFIAQFELTTLDPAEFNHLGHIRLCWLYLNQYTEDVAIDRVAKGINAYATSLGAPDKYHQTITVALCKIISKRREKQKSAHWLVFCEQNQDLIFNAKALLKHYYSEKLISSEGAKRQFIAPDRKAF